MEDTPRFGHRGVLVDTARHWFSVEDLKRKILDPMHATKMNVLHWCVAWGVAACLPARMDGLPWCGWGWIWALGRAPGASTVGSFPISLQQGFCVPPPCRALPSASTQRTVPTPARHLPTRRAVLVRERRHVYDSQSQPLELRFDPRLWLPYSKEQRFTQEDAREVVRYAFARGIRVLPEFDLPGAPLPAGARAGRDGSRGEEGAGWRAALCH